MYRLIQVGLLGLAFVAPSALATLVGIRYDATIPDVSTGPDFPALNLLGFFIYDSNALDVNPFPTTALFPDAGGLAGLVNGRPVLSSTLEIGANQTGMNFTAYPIDLGFYDANWDVRYMQLLTSGWGITADPSGFDVLPTSLDVADIASATIGVSFQNRLTGEIQSFSFGLIPGQLSTFTVPEPGTLSLLAAGLLALGFMRRRVAA